MTKLTLFDEQFCAGICGQYWSHSPFCPDCLAMIIEDSQTGEAECWIDIPGWEGKYQASSFGRVRSVDRVVIDTMGRSQPKNGVLLKQTIGCGYPFVSLWQNDKHPRVRVHTLVTRAFLGECPPGLEVLHRDDVRTDNRLFQLRYGTHSANMHDGVRNGHHVGANKTHCPDGHEYTPENTIIGKRGDGTTFRLCRTCKRDYRQRNRDTINTQDRERRQRNRDAINARKRELRRQNRDAVNARKREWSRRRKETDE
jgi:hypothetical protein